MYEMEGNGAWRKQVIGDYVQKINGLFRCLGIIIILFLSLCGINKEMMQQNA